jgi:diguanylate cyclase (GGDEF)-like protein
MTDYIRFKQLQDNLLSLTGNSQFSELSFYEKLQQLLTLGAQDLGASRASFWRYEEMKDALDCVLMHGSSEELTAGQEKIYRSNAPGYFEVLRNNHIIDASDALNDPRTSEQPDLYLKKHDIHSMLDIPVSISGTFYGIVSFEYQALPYSWDVAELALATAIADRVAIAVEQEQHLNQTSQIDLLERIDNLTGLEHRSIFQQRIRESRKSDQYPGKLKACIAFGVNDFVEINAKYGFAAADWVLKEVARRLHVFANKTPSNISRLGGDVFGVLLLDINDQKEIEHKVSLIQKLIARPFGITSKQEVNVSVCMGVITFSNDDSMDDPAGFAEIAMSTAKKNNKAPVKYVDHLWLQKLESDKQLEVDIRCAVESGNQFIAHYQPILSSEVDAVVGIEALARWQHPTRGMLFPNDFIQPVIDLGLMPDMGRQMLRNACKDLRELRDTGYKVSWVSVNLSAEQLYDTKLVHDIESLLQEYRLEPSALELEIVEELISKESSLAKAQIDAIAELGIKLSIDDFGTGHSSLSRLKHLPVSKLKIDRSFVEGLPLEESDECIVRSIIGLARGMNFDLVAEGIETQEQKKWLVSHGCDLLQGYLFAKPLPLSELKPYLKTQASAIEHIGGNFSIRVSGNIFEITPYGKWRTETATRFFKELNQLVNNLDGHEWATIVDARNWHIATRSVQDVIREQTALMTERNLRCEAFVIRESELAQYQSEIISPSTPHYCRKIFGEKRNAKQWLLGEGFDFLEQAVQRLGTLN